MRSPGKCLIAAASLVLLIVLAVFPSPASPAPAGYGTTSTTAGQNTDASCTVTVGEASPGSTVSGTAFDVVPGEIEVFFGGESVAQVTATGTEVDFSFIVPALDPGDYSIVITGATFNATCSVPGGGTGFAVLGEDISRGTGGGGGLPFTGFSALALVSVAVALIIVGWLFRRSSGARPLAAASRRG